MRREIAICATVLGLTGCGVNTDTPVYPIYSILSVGTPAIINAASITQVEPIPTPTPPEFKISFYVTNQEDEFIGYNLYITENYVSGDAFATLIGQPYLPNGVEPSFPYTKSDASTKAADLKTQTIVAFKPPPSPTPFYYCRYYYFALRALLRNGATSPSSPQVSSCILDPNYCPTTADCK